MNLEVKSASRVLDMLELLASERQGISLTDVTERLSLPKSSALALLRTLVGRGYLIRDSEDLYELAESFRATGFAPFGRLLVVAPPIMRTLADEVGETVLLGALADNGTVRLLAKEVAYQDIRYDIDLSCRPAAYCTSIGRILLAKSPDAYVHDVLASVPKKGPTAHTITAKAFLWDQIVQARKTGIAIVEEEAELGGTGVAAVIPGDKSVSRSALNIACVTSRFHEKKDKVMRLLRGAVNKIAADM